MGRGPSRITPDGQKWCPGCQAFLLADLFSVSKSKKDGLKSHCKECDSDINSKFYASCPEKGLDRQYKRNYGIDGDVYRELHKKQQEKCAACGGEEQGMFNGKAKRLAVDHCHRTGKIRGLLCSDCNLALGHLKDDPDRIRALLKYIEE